MQLPSRANMELSIKRSARDGMVVRTSVEGFAKVAKTRRYIDPREQFDIEQNAQEGRYCRCR